MTRAEIPTLHTEDIPDLPYRLALDDLSPSRWEITAEEDAKIARAARPNLVMRAIGGDVEARKEMEKLHLTLWEVRR